MIARFDDTGVSLCLSAHDAARWAAGRREVTRELAQAYARRYKVPVTIADHNGRALEIVPAPRAGTIFGDYDCCGRPAPKGVGSAWSVKGTKRP